MTNIIIGLIERDAKVDDIDNQNLTPLHYAAKVTKVQMLLELWSYMGQIKVVLIWVNVLLSTSLQNTTIMQILSKHWFN